MYYQFQQAGEDQYDGMRRPTLGHSIRFQIRIHIRIQTD